jgi:hypothetical protein
MAHRLPLFQTTAYRWYSGEDQPGYPRTPAGPLVQRSSAQRGRGGVSVGQEYRSRRRTARLLRSKPWSIVPKRQRNPAPKEGVKVDWQKLLPPRASGVTSSTGGGAEIFMDRPQYEDEQRLQEVMCEWRSVGICCHDSPHDEAVDPSLRAFHTASQGTWVNKLRILPLRAASDTASGI